MRVLNKAEKDYSNDPASQIQKEYKATRSTREAIIEARRRSFSARTATELINPMDMSLTSGYARRLLTNPKLQMNLEEPKQKSVDFAQYPVVLTTPSLFS